MLRIVLSQIICSLNIVVELACHPFLEERLISPFVRFFIVGEAKTFLYRAKFKLDVKVCFILADHVINSHEF